MELFEYRCLMNRKAHPSQSLDQRSLKLVLDRHYCCFDIAQGQYESAQDRRDAWNRGRLYLKIHRTEGLLWQ